MTLQRYEINSNIQHINS